MPSRKSITVLCGILCFFLFYSALLAAPPQEKILLIYYADTTSQQCANGTSGAAGDTYPQQIETAFYNAINVIDPAANIQTLLIHSGDVGIASELHSQYGTYSLTSWCQVYDLRFLDECDNQGWTSGQNAPDVLTTSGANNDFQIYQNYIQQGGSLFLQGEHHDFYERNSNLLQLINTMASTPVVSTICSTNLCADVNTGNPVTFSNFATSNYGFSTNYNNLSAAASLIGVFVGGIPNGYYGSGQALVTLGGFTQVGGDPNGAMMVGWEGSALSGAYAAGKVVASFETNAFATATDQTAWSFQVIQNVYTLLSGCLHYSVTKTFNQTSLCVGQSGSFTICADNTSSLSTISNYSISDTLPTCLSYTSSMTSVPATSGNSGNLYWWTFSSLAPGASACVTVQFSVANNTCP